MSIPILRFRLTTATIPRLYTTPISYNLAATSRLKALTSHLSSPNSSRRTFTSTATIMSPPSTMKAILVNEAGGPDVLKYTDSQPIPKPSSGQVLVKNDIAGVNFIDTYFRTGLYPPPAGYPMIIGQEGVGTIADANGNSLGFKEGDKVLWIKSGGYAEYTAVPADRVIHLPAGVDADKALGGFLMGMTALSLIKEAFEVKKGMKVLVHAAAGGMGLILCQLLRDVGAYTIGTAGSPEKCKLAKENGADECIDYNANAGEKWVEKVKELTGGEGVDVVYDSVGKTTWEGSLDAVKRKGKVVYWGNASGPTPPIALTKLTAKNISIMRSTVMGYIVTREELEYYANMALDLIKSGKLNIKIHGTYDLKDAKRAHEDLEGRKTTGKLLLKC